ncbi:MAG: MMPL family transporter, partial [Nitriliruptor sp.]|uniref:MMPL family transporter n=1 Tax=Nitriliruptor sp. TaxID=2448056 RepID=UPI0034A01E83
MNALLRRIAGTVERRPGVSLVVILVLTVVFGALATQQSTDTDLAAFAAESELAAASERISEEFGTASAAVQVIVDAGEGGDVLSAEGLATAAELGRVVERTPELTDILAPGTPQAPAVISYAAPFQAALDEQGVDPGTVDDDALDAIAVGMLGDPQVGPQAGALLSRDLDAEAGSARAGLVIVRLAGDVEVADQAAGELAFRDAVEAADLGPFTVSPFSENILSDDLMADMEQEMPVLLGLAFLLIIAILFVTYRRVSDVLLGLVGLVVTIVWTYGIAVLVGPDYLGITGPMTQISIIIPVLLIGLAIDYAIHLTTRYREELGKGRTPAQAASGAVFSVGGALVLATLTTMIGFL